ncbi:hypothetical protein COCSUDRAFT_44735 [Coccomyxa subellipsoidea C-169]|uniref:Band 7 domain-containing protein n=1 Tax=Coccomyxa subellipsoidea (strain C-169) TaxID=574566 RepID=I0YLY2_COCSC|nr:hypothetical protein COCSUDRAFT_44735 [Coccomyxa subellipsoidea C-169]EIE19401.1 hypothetical protein COCSUDRAFT_44735 [Coccomyxa subellipsoidea C-169]|eukprot:XP_005643945.1 hypothetical protein COCSUDRAFT_44735 [Coccomyxa subellipsoidea C-169]
MARDHERDSNLPAMICGAVCFLISGVLITVLLVFSFSYVDFYEVFSTGRYLNGPDKLFRKFNTDANYVEYPQLNIFTSDKLDTYIDIYYIYFIKPQEIGALKLEFDQNYDPRIKDVGQSALKNRATMFPTEAYFQNRTLIEEQLYDALQTALIPYHVTVPQLFLGHVIIPDTVAQKQLSSAKQFEVYDSQAQLTRRTTDQMVNAINNNATIVLQNASSLASMTVKVAQASALVTVSAAKNIGLRMLYDALNVTRGDQKARLDYVQSLLNNPATTLHVGYDTRFLASGH